MTESMDECQLIVTGDLVITKHTHLSFCNTLVTGLISQKEQKRLKPYLDTMSKFLTAFLSYYIEPLRTLLLPLDFILKNFSESK